MCWYPNYKKKITFANLCFFFVARKLVKYRKLTKLQLITYNHAKLLQTERRKVTSFKTYAFNHMHDMLIHQSLRYILHNMYTEWNTLLCYLYFSLRIKIVLQIVHKMCSWKFIYFICLNHWKMGLVQKVL